MPDELRDRADGAPSRPPTGFGAVRAAVETERRAEPPRAPQLPLTLQKRERERTALLRAREVLERVSVLRGLVILALLILVVSLVRAGSDRAFPSGWWRQW